MAVESQDPLDELMRENGLTERLVERLAEFAIFVGERQDVSPGEIAEGLRLLEQYQRVHAVRIDKNLQPEARTVAPDTCLPHLDAILQDHQTEGDRIGRARMALDAFARDPGGARARLSKELADLTERDYQTLGYENDCPLSCLRDTLPDKRASRDRGLSDEAVTRVTKAFQATSSDLEELEGHIARYLDRTPETPTHPLVVRCRRAHCGAAAVSHMMPSNDGRLGFEVPAGWRVITRPPVVGTDGTIRLKVDFCCPEHHAESSEREERALGTWMDEGGSAPPRGETEVPETVDVCGLIPPDPR
jgi:hypothetical protein